MEGTGPCNPTVWWTANKKHSHQDLWQLYNNLFRCSRFLRCLFFFLPIRNSLILYNYPCSRLHSPSGILHAVCQKIWCYVSQIESSPWGDAKCKPLPPLSITNLYPNISRCQLIMGLGCGGPLMSFEAHHGWPNAAVFHQFCHFVHVCLGLGAAQVAIPALALWLNVPRGISAPRLHKTRDTTRTSFLWIQWHIIKGGTCICSFNTSYNKSMMTSQFFKNHPSKGKQHTPQWRRLFLRSLFLQPCRLSSPAFSNLSYLLFSLTLSSLPRGPRLLWFRTLRLVPACRVQHLSSNCQTWIFRWLLKVDRTLWSQSMSKIQVISKALSSTTPHPSGV